jgi:hypothetical protein
MTIRYRYTCPDGSLRHPGIPAQDLTDEDLADLTPAQRRTVQASELYEKISAVEPAGPAKEDAS